MTETTRISFGLDDELLMRLKAITDAPDGPSQSKYIRAALEEKLGRVHDAQTELLLDRFKRLTDKGKQWLLDAALYASTSDEVRQITPRSRKKKDE